MTRIILLFAAIFFCLNLFAQEESNKIFTQDAFFEMVLKNHPVVKQGNLLMNLAESEIRKARGSFDPKIAGNIDQKTFDGKNYYTIAEAGFKIPTWYGLEFKGAYDWAEGIFLNPEESLPANGQATLGVKANLLQGLFIDERRASLRQAQIFMDLNQAERQELINEVLKTAGETYWEWAYSYQIMQIYQQAIDLATVRLEGIRESFSQGDKPAIDTLETLIQVQTRQAEWNDAWVKFRNLTLKLSNFLWTEDSIPLEITDLLVPEPLEQELPFPISSPERQSLLNELQVRHPTLLSYQFKMDQLEIERKLKTDKFKPKLEVEYNILGNQFNFLYGQKDDISTVNALLRQNFKWNATLSFPLLWRKESGDLQKTQIKILDTQYKIQEKRLKLKNILLENINLQDNLLNQINLQSDMVNNYSALLDAENEKFSIGESSIFLINSREQKLIEAQMKLAKLQMEAFKSDIYIQWATGQLGNGN